MLRASDCATKRHFTKLETRSVSCHSAGFVILKETLKLYSTGFKSCLSVCNGVFVADIIDIISLNYLIKMTILSQSESGI